MKTLNSLALSLCLIAGVAFGQTNTMYSTTLSVAALSTDACFTMTSVTNMVAPAPGTANPTGSQLYIVDLGSQRGETAMVQTITGSVVCAARGRTGIRSAHANGALVLFGPANWFRLFDPNGGCTTASLYITPHVNTESGNQWLCSTITLTWVPGFQNGMSEPQVTAAVASVAGATAVNGPLQHVTGTNAITSFTMGVGWNGGPFCLIPDAIFTTTKTNNIGLASTAVVAKPLCYVYDATNAVFDPSY